VLSSLEEIKLSSGSPTVSAGEVCAPISVRSSSVNSGLYCSLDVAGDFEDWFALD
jgi:hypothetical protein